MKPANNGVNVNYQTDVEPLGPGVEGFVLGRRRIVINSLLGELDRWRVFLLLYPELLKASAGELIVLRKPL